jgi:hypothetical protein
MKKKLIKSSVCSVTVCGSEMWTLGRNGERVVSGFETWRWRGTLKINWTDRIKNEEVFQRAKEERLLLKVLQNRRHSWIGHTIRHKEFVANILEGATSGKKGRGKASTAVLKECRQKHSS